MFEAKFWKHLLNQLPCSKDSRGVFYLTGVGNVRLTTGKKPAGERGRGCANVKYFTFTGHRDIP